MDVNYDEWREMVRRRLIFLGHLPGSAEQFRILTIQQLHGRGRSVSYLEEQAKTNSLSDEKGFVVLVGKLVSALDEVSCKDYHLLPSDLMFSDSSGQIPCFVVDVSPSVVDRMAIIYEWTFLKLTSGLQYLEIGKMEFLNSRSRRKPESKLLAFIPRDARFLQTNRHIIGTDLVNLIGQVSAVSHPMRYKNAVIFLILFQDSEANQRVVVLNRSIKKAYWQMLIRPRQEYVLTNLQPTTLSLSEDKISVLLITDDSECHLASEISGCTKMIKIQDYLRERGFNEEMFLAWKNSKENEESNFHHHSCNIVKYEGTVTNTELSHLGIFELNGAVKVHLKRISEIRSFQHLRVYTKITLFNVHILKSTQESYKVICCCWYGCVRIDSFSKDLTQLNPESLVSIDESLKSLVPIITPILSDCRLPFVDFDLAFDSAKTLQRQFCPRIIKNLVSQLLRNVVCGNRSQMNCKPIMEFITDDHAATCGISAKSVKKDAFRMVTVSDLCRDFQDFEAEIKGKLMTVEEPGWKCQYIASKDLSPHLVVVAVLQCNSLTAKLQLCDQTGSIDCIIVNALDAPIGISDLHQCMDGNCCKSEEVRYPFRPLCPFPQTWSIGGLFRLSEFRIVRESFSQPSSYSSQPGKPLVCLYVEFSLIDALCLCKLDALHPSWRWFGPNDKEISNRGKRPKLTSTAGNMEGSHQTRADFRENFTQDDCRTREENAPIASTQLRPNGNMCRCSVAQKFLIFHKQSTRSRSTLPGIASLSFSLDALLFGDVDKYGCGCKTAAAVGHHTMPSATVTGRRVCLLFQNKSALWYPLLHVGCVYRLTAYGQDKSEIFDGSTLSPELQKLGAKPEIALNKNIRVDRIFSILNDDAVNGPLPARLCISVMEHIMIKPFIEDLKKKSNKMLQEMREGSLTEGESELFSFKGAIIARGFREHPTNRFEPRKNPKQTDGALLQLGVEITGGVGIWLAVRELASSEEHHVFINLSQTQYPLGLFVRSVVHLEKLERCASGKKRPYFKFLSISSCTLLSFPQVTWKDLGLSLDGVTRSKPRTISKFHQSDHPKVYIQDLLEASSASSTSVLISCQIYKIFYLLLEFSCASHGLVRTDEAGKCVECEGSMEFRALARFKIGDGSGTAVVSCHDDQVAGLLNLKTDEWEELKSFVGEFGGFKSYHDGEASRPRSDPYPTAAAVLVNAICESRSVLRPVVLEAKPLKETNGNDAIKRRPFEKMRIRDFDQQQISLGGRTVLKTLRPPDIRLQYISLCEFTFPNSVMS